MSNERDPLAYVVRDDRYANLTAHDLKVIRANMIQAGAWTKTNYEAALVQFWIMQKEGRLPKELY